MTEWLRDFFRPKKRRDDFFDTRKLLMSPLTPRSSFHGMTFAAKKAFARRRPFRLDNLRRTTTLVLFCLCASAVAWAQSGTLGSASSPVVNAFGRPMAGVNVSICQPLATAAAQVISNTAVLTMAGNPITAGFAAGMTMEVSGFTGNDTYFNGGAFTNGTGITGGYTILSVTSTTITYSLTHANATASSSGALLQQGNATTPCAGLSAIYSDPGMTQPITQPIVTDGYGNWNAFGQSGQLYYVQFHGSGVTTSMRWIMVNVSANAALKPAASDANQYVSPNGNDTNDGLSMGTAKLTPQAAVNALPSGNGTIYVANGTTVLTGSGAELIKITGVVNFQCQSQNAVLQVAASVATGIIPMHVVPAGALRGFKLTDCSFSDLRATPYAYSVQLDTSPNNNLSMFLIDHIFSLHSIWLNNTGAEANGGFFDGTIQNSFFSLLTCTLCGDSLNVHNNLMILDNNSDVNNISFTPGSASFRLKDNTIEAPIHLGAAAFFCEISGNEMETVIGTTTGSNGAFMDLDGTMANPINNCVLHNNSYQIVNSSTLNGLRLNYAAQTSIGGQGVENNFEAGVGGAHDIVTTANTSGTLIGTNKWNGSSWSTILSDSGSGTLSTVNQSAAATPIVYQQQSSGTTTMLGTGGFPLLQGVSGASYIYDSNGSSGIVAGAFAGSFVGSLNPPPKGWFATGGMSNTLATKSSAYTLTCLDYWVNVTGTTTITVPHAACVNTNTPINSSRWVVFNSGSGTVTVQADSGNINGAASITLAANTGKEVTCDGTNCFAH